MQVLQKHYMCPNRCLRSPREVVARILFKVTISGTFKIQIKAHNLIEKKKSNDKQQLTKILAPLLQFLQKNYMCSNQNLRTSTEYN